MCLPLPPEADNLRNILEIWDPRRPGTCLLLRRSLKKKVATSRYTVSWSVCSWSSEPLQVSQFACGTSLGWARLVNFTSAWPEILDSDPVWVNLETSWWQLIRNYKHVHTSHGLNHCIDLPHMWQQSTFFSKKCGTKSFTVMGWAAPAHALQYFWGEVQCDVLEHRGRAQSQPSVNICFCECLATGRRTN